MKPEPACTCAAAFDLVVEGVETDYAGYQIKVDARRREAYEGFKSILKTDAAEAGADRCKEVLDTFVDFFQDYHVFVLQLDGIGITPDVPLPDHLADPLAFAVRLLAEGS